MDSSDTLPVVIAGAGFCGLALAAQLLERGQAVVLVGCAANFGRGTAYGDAWREHLLNVPADRMGLRADAPAAFADWLDLQGDERRRFRPRLEFGDYLAHELGNLHARYGERLRCIEAGITAITRDTDARWRIALDSGETLESGRLVLALGAANTASTTHDDTIIRQPWAQDALANIDADAPVLILGTGLTMIDMVLALQAQGHRGAITALSRRGRLPLLHPEPPLPPTPPSPALLAALEAGDLRAAVREFRAAIDAGAAPPTLADGLRALIPQLWRGWSLPTRKRFLRHLRPWWDSVRHRVPGEVFATLDRLREEGRLQIRAGHLLGHENGSARIRWRGEHGDTMVPVGAVIDATGWDGDRDRYAAHPALSALIADGRLRIDPLGLGLDCAADGSVPGADGLHLIGFLRRGECWESTAVPELRAQAAALAEQLAAY
ncbi:FAD/NAD(P)-binding protein [Solilutibacter silvestris]|uniref:FAD/NAD(P)-binding protein n=1 Tax=Solilutibacter silvestris TaxID=1645665 RepID=UPI003D349190